MSRPMKRLWRRLGAVGEAPVPAPKDVKRRVNAMLNEDPSERRLYMKQRTRLALALGAAVLALSTMAVAVATHLDVLEAFFEGDTSPAKGLVDDQPRTASDGSFRLTVTSSVSDENDTYMLLQVDALNEQAAATLLRDDFVNMDTFHIAPLKDGEHARAEGPDEGALGSWSMGEQRQLRTDTTRVWDVDVTRPGPTDTIRVWLEVMGKEHAVDVPVVPVQSVEVTIGAEGRGTATLENAEGGMLRVEQVALSPFTCQVAITREKGEPEGAPLVLFRMADGTLRSQSQMMKEISGHVKGEGGRTGYVWNYRFHQVQDMSRIRGLVVFGKEYPLDGGAARAVTDDGALQPFRLPLQEGLAEDLGYAIGVRGLCQGLGADCRWDGASRTVTCRYRDVTIVLTPGSKTALVNGEPVEMQAAPVVREGALVACPDLFDDYWSIYSLAAFGGDWSQRVCWVVTP